MVSPCTPQPYEHYITMNTGLLDIDASKISRFHYRIAEVAANAVAFTIASVRHHFILALDAHRYRSHYHGRFRREL